MSNQVDLYNSTYGNFQERVLAEIRRETYGEDIGQNSWITTSEYDAFYSWLNLSAGDHLLEVASGSGGPALYLARKFGLKVAEVPVVWAHSEGTRISPLRDGPRMFLEMLKIRWNALSGKYSDPRNRSEMAQL